MKYPEIFNDILSPVTPGPSSSNTCGVARISFLSRQIFGSALPNKVLVEMSDAGNFPASFFGMRSDLAIAHGILGRQAWEPGFSSAIKEAERKNIRFDFRFTDMLPGKPEELIRITLSGEGRRPVTVIGYSKGGGNIEIIDINSYPISLEGNEYELLVECNEGAETCGEAARYLLGERLLKEECIKKEGRILLRFGCSENIETDVVKIIAGSNSWRILPPVIPVLCFKEVSLPFETGEELCKYLEKYDVSLWDAALAYEKAVCGWSEKKIIDYLSNLLRLVTNAYSSRYDYSKNYLERTVFGGETNSDIQLNTGIIGLGSSIAMRIMRHSNHMGLIVGMPTAGSAGVVPGVLIAAADSMSLSEEKLLQSFMVAGLIGVFMSKTNFFGTYGCQMEIGCAAGMAAGGLAYMMGGKEEALEAASMALQNYIGLVCDPVAGCVISPCIIRNMCAVGVAVTCAQQALNGMKSVIPLDEIVDSMMRVGERTQGCGKLGARGTPTGIKICNKLNDGESYEAHSS